MGVIALILGCELTISLYSRVVMFETPNSRRIASIHGLPLPITKMWPPELKYFLTNQETIAILFH